MATPASTVSMTRAWSRWSAGTEASAEPAASDAAVVVVTTIIRVLEVSPPPSGPATYAYSPYAGLTPTSVALAIPSGTLLIAPGSPATRSARRSARRGRTDRAQDRSLTGRDGVTVVGGSGQQ